MSPFRLQPFLFGQRVVCHIAVFDVDGEPLDHGSEVLEDPVGEVAFVVPAAEVGRKIIEHLADRRSVGALFQDRVAVHTVGRALLEEQDLQLVVARVDPDHRLTRHPEPDGDLARLERRDGTRARRRVLQDVFGEGVEIIERLGFAPLVHQLTEEHIPRAGRFGRRHRNQPPVFGFQ